MPQSRRDDTGARVQMRSTDVDQAAVERETNVSRNLTILRQCAQDLGYTYDALAAVMPVGRAYIGNVFNGEKPLRLEFEVAMPRDLQTEYRKRQAEELGLVVVEQLSGVAAQRAFVAGALGLFASGLPERASAMAKASIPVRAAAVSA